MFIIPGVLIAIITFPGVIVHELSHQIFCRLRRVPVYEVKYFQVKSPCGYVIHEPSDNPMTTFIISAGPFILNTIVGALILLPASVEMVEFNLFSSLRASNVDLAYFLTTIPVLLSMWLGISILMHAFPSAGDARAIVATVLKNKDVSVPTKILMAPFVGMMYLGALGSFVWLDLGYAILVAFLLPKFIGLFL